MENYLENKANTSTETPSILVVDDSKDIVNVTKDMLEKICSGCKIDTGKNWEELFGAVSKKQYAMLITNQMSITNEFNAIETIRKIQKEIPIILTNFMLSEKAITYIDSIKKYNISHLPKAFYYRDLETEVNKYLPIKLISTSN